MTRHRYLRISHIPKLDPGDSWSLYPLILSFFSEHSYLFFSRLFFVNKKGYILKWKSPYISLLNITSEYIFYTQFCVINFFLFLSLSGVFLRFEFFMPLYIRLFYYFFLVKFQLTFSKTQFFLLHNSKKKVYNERKKKFWTLDETIKWKRKWNKKYILLFKSKNSTSRKKWSTWNSILLWTEVFNFYSMSMMNSEPFFREPYSLI